RSVLGICSHPDGIKLCPDKTATVLQLPSPRTIKEVQSLNGKLASLNRFLSKSVEKSLLLFKTLKKCIKKSDFHWTAEAEQAFKQLKQYLSELPILVAPKPKEELIIYLSATYGAISAVLITERGATQKLIYFISHTLQGPHYQSTHQANHVSSRRGRTAAKIEYHARRAQYYVHAKNVGQRTDLSRYSHRDAGRKPISHASGRNSTRAMDTFHGRLIMCGRVRLAWMGVKNVHVSVDSKLVANQVQGTYVAKEDNMVKYVDKVKGLAVVPSVVVKMCWTAPGRVCGEIVSDNGKQFSDNPFKDWCDKLNITQRFASVKHPQSNGLVERANRSLGEGIKARLGKENKNWVKELPHILWAHRTMIKSSHGDTPFSLTYGTEAVIPTEIGMPMYPTAAVDVVSNDKELWLNLDLLEELRERAAICEAKAKSKMTNHTVAGGKLGPKWEGPYEVTEALGDGAYKLRSMDGTILPRTWNIANLKRRYL
nr:reverse transcriptase domain-containing protein [Tanacetum cinerariifolium]